MRCADRITTPRKADPSTGTFAKKAGTPGLQRCHEIAAAVTILAVCVPQSNKPARDDKGVLLHAARVHITFSMPSWIMHRLNLCVVQLST